jgi:putative hydrolase of the HAD superfamily
MIFFDLDDTLVNNSTAQKQAICSFVIDKCRVAFNDTNLLKNKWHEFSNYYYDKYFKGEIDLQTQRTLRMQKIFGLLGKPIDKATALLYFSQYYELYLEKCVIFEDVLPCLNKLKKYKLGIISNGHYDIQTKKLKNNGIFEFFDSIITSDIVGVAKPNSKIFNYASKSTNVSIDKCIYIGDLYDIDILPSLKSGMKSIWLNRNNYVKKDPEIISIHSLKALPAILKNIRL